MDPLMNSLQLDQGETIERRSTILVIDDHETVRTFLSNCLNEVYTIREASSSEEGVQLAKQIVPDLIITSLTTLTFDNECVCFHLKHCENTNHIPIVILSEENDPSNRIKSFYFGADDYMALPLQHAELQIRIENLIQSRRTLQQKFSKQIDLKPSSIPLLSKDERFLRQVESVMAINLNNPLFGSEKFAEEMGISPRHLSRKLISLTGQSSNEFIRKKRLTRAAELLNKETGSVKEVAQQVGFNNLSYFAKCFKQFHHHSPSDFSKRMNL